MVVERRTVIVTARTRARITLGASLLRVGDGRVRLER